MARKLVVEIIGDSRSFERALNRSERSARSFQATITKTGRGLTSAFAAVGVGIGAGAAISGIRNMVNAASDLNEQIGKTEVVFGDSADSVVAWSKKTAVALGESQRQALNAASGFGALLAPLGLTGEQAAKQSRKLTELGADLASFYNTDVQEALDAIRSGLVGEAEPLRRYGALLSESRVQAEAMAETGKRTAASLTDQEKVLARIHLILQDTAQAQGDFARSSDRLAGQQKILTAQIDDLKTSLGEALLPAVTNVVTQFNNWLANPENKKRVIHDFETGIHDVGVAAQFTAGAVEGLVNAFSDLRDARNRLKNWGGKGPSGLDIFGFLGPETREFLGRLGGANLNTPGIGPGGVPPGLRGPTFGLVGPVGGGPEGRYGIQMPGTHRFPFRVGGTAQVGLTPQQRAEQSNRWFDAMIGRLLGRAEDPTTLRGQIAKLRTIAGLLQQELSATKDATRRVNLIDQLADIAVRVRGKQKQMTDEAQAARQAALDERLGWLQFAAERAESTKTLVDDLKIQRRIEKYWKERLQHEGRTLEIVSELWRTREKIRELNKKGTDAEMAATRFVRRDPAKLAAMLGLGGNQYATAMLAAYGRGGTLPSRGGQFSGTGVVIHNANFNGITDVTAFENAMTKQGRAKAHNRRGAR